MTKKGAKQSDIDALFASLIDALRRGAGVTQSKMFGSPGLKVRGKVFAMLVKGKLVVKLPRERVDGLVESGKGEYFDPGHGRLMKEWAAVSPSAKAMWLKLAKEAREFVASDN